MPAPSTYGAPGVYVEWLDKSAQQLEVGRTDVAGFIGVAERGPLHTARKIESFRQFVSTFGRHVEQSYLAYAVEGFFANGGRTCWVVRVADPAAAKKARVALSIGGAAPFVLEAGSEGMWGNAIRIDSVWSRDGITRLIATDGDRPSQVIDLDGKGQPLVEVQRTPSGLHQSDLPELATGALVALSSAQAADAITLGVDRRSAQLADGDDGLASMTSAHFGGDADGKTPLGVDALTRIDGVSFVAAPDLVFPADPLAPSGVRAVFTGAASRDAQLAVLASCVKRRDRIFLLDLPRGDQNAALASVDAPADAVRMPRDRTAGSFGAVYHPWIIVSDPLRLAGPVRAIPPTGHVAGMFARTDRLRGVHKPPANEVLEGVWDVTEAIDNTAHARLNDASINAIRAIPGRDVRVLGARTLAEDPAWRYVNVRRLFAMIEEALDEQMQWLVFEPNSPRLWREIDRAVRGFLERLFRAGMLDGATSDEAYFVSCDETTNPPSSTDDGRVICELGLQPPYPAEFVIVRVGVTRSGIEIEEKGAQDG
jgi:hypothetical protein